MDTSDTTSRNSSQGTSVRSDMSYHVRKLNYSSRVLYKSRHHCNLLEVEEVKITKQLDTRELHMST